MDEREMRERLRELQARHRALDAELAVVLGGGNVDAVADTVARMRAKKLKLRLRDEIVTLESMLIPDIIA